MSGITPYFFDLAGNLNYAKKLVQRGFVRAQTVDRAERALNDSGLNESRKIEYLLFIGFEFAGHVLNNYWTLKPYLMEKVSSTFGFISAIKKQKMPFVIEGQRRSSECKLFKLSESACRKNGASVFR